MWDKTLAKCGSNEIGSELIKFYEKNQHAKKLVMISDACRGQLRNQFIAALCLYLVTKTPNLKVIDHIFMVYMVSGHSHMEVDSMHTWIEWASDTLNMYVSYEMPIVASVAWKNPYVVKLFDQSDTKHLKIFKTDIKLTNLKVNTNGEPVHWTSGKGCCPMILFSGRNKEKLNLTKPFVVPTTTRQSFSLKSLFSKKQGNKHFLS